MGGLGTAEPGLGTAEPGLGTDPTGLGPPPFVLPPAPEDGPPPPGPLPFAALDPGRGVPTAVGLGVPDATLAGKFDDWAA